MLGADVTLIAVSVAGGAVGALTLEHGWGWVLAKWHARVDRLESEAQSVTDIAKIKDDIDKLKQKVGL